MTLKEQIKTYLINHPESKLEDLYKAFVDQKREHIRSVLNSNLKNSYFIRVKRGVYK